MKNKFEKKLLASNHTVLKQLPTDVSDEIDPKEAKEQLKEIRKKLSAVQDKMYAHNRYSVLVCLQGMDTSGKDSLIREVFQGFNARGVVVNSFKTPSAIELQHDYLWRHSIALPPKGKFGVFNRTHYENVLVTRVHPEYLLKENLPGIQSIKQVPDNFWKKRYNQINQFEKHLVETGTILFKFFLHLSKAEQKNRLLRRLEKEKHQWKFEPGDLAERKLWSDYMAYYQEAIQHTSPSHAPWHIIPSDDKDVSRYLVAQTILDTLSGFKDIQYPKTTAEVAANLEQYKQALGQG